MTQNVFSKSLSMFEETGLKINFKLKIGMLEFKSGNHWKLYSTIIKIS